MDAIRISPLFGRLVVFFALAGTLAAQPEFSFHAAPEPWVFAAQAAKLHMGSRSFLGVGVVEIAAERAKELNLKEERGVEITRVQEDSPAANYAFDVTHVPVSLAQLGMPGCFVRQYWMS